MSWFEANDAAKRSGTNDRANGLRAEREFAKTCANRGGGTTARTAWRVFGVVRVARGAWCEVGKFSRDSFSEN